MENCESATSGWSSLMEGKVFADFDITKYLKVTEVSGLNNYTGMNSLRAGSGNE
ncbi:MAG: hypothetical protein R2941_13205 [Desulfobacterales bacterium]